MADLGDFYTVECVKKSFLPPGIGEDILIVSTTLIYILSSDPSIPGPSYSVIFAKVRLFHSSNLAVNS